MTDDATKKFEGGMVYCVCCKTTLSANKSIFGISPWFPLEPPDHFCKNCAKWLDVTQYEWPTPRTSSHPCG